MIAVGVLSCNSFVLVGGAPAWRRPRSSHPSQVVPVWGHVWWRTEPVKQVTRRDARNVKTVMAAATQIILTGGAALEEGRRVRGLRVILGSIFLIQAGFFLIIPLLSLHYVDELGWAAAFLGLVLAVRQFTQQGLTIFGGVLADRLGAKPLILLGVLIRALSFAVMGLSATQEALLLSGVLAAIGGALYDAPIRAVIAAMARPDELQDYYARLGIARNLAQMVGPAVGAIMIGFSFAVVGYGAAVFMVLTFVVMWWGIPGVEISTLDEQEAAGGRGGTAAVFAGLRRVWDDRPFVMFTALSIGFWFMWVQLSIAFPLVAKSLSGSNGGVGMFLTINSLFAVAIQFPVLWLSRRYFRPDQMVVAGTAVATLGLGAVSLATSLWHLYAAAFLFSLGVVIVMPNVQTVVALMSNVSARGAYMGFNALALAIGGGLGNMIGGTLIDLAASWQWAALPWLVYAAVGLVTAVGLGVFVRLRES